MAHAAGQSRRSFLASLTFSVLLLTASAVLAAAPRQTAQAHARLVWGTPGPDDVLNAAPTQVDAYFAEDIVKQSGTYALAVTDAAGNAVDNQDTVLDDGNRRHMTVTLQSGLGAGSYTVTWKTVSDEDGDAASGSYSFTVVGA